MANVYLTLGCILMAATFPLLAYLFILSQRPLLVIISLISALFFLVAILIISLVMFPISPDKGEQAGRSYVYPVTTIIISSVIQELCRFSFIYVFRKIMRASKSIIGSPNAPKSLRLEDSAACIASGMGIASAHLLISTGFVFAATIPRLGDYFTDSCENIPLQYLTAWIGIEFFVLDILLMIIAFRAEKHQSIPHYCAVFILHMAAGFCTISNISLGEDWHCMTSVYFLVGVLAVTVLYIIIVPSDVGVYSNRKIL